MERATNSPDRVDFERFGLWPVLLQMPSGGGYTLWGDGLHDSDVLLAAGGKVVFATSIAELASFVREGLVVNVSEREGYRLLRPAVDTLEANSEPFAIFPITDVASWLQKGVSKWRRPMVETALNCTNMLLDFAVTVGDRLTIEALQPERPLGEFVDLLYEVLGLLHLETPKPIEILRKAKDSIDERPSELIVGEYISAMFRLDAATEFI